MRLGKKQELFASLVPKLILKAIELGFTVRLGEVHRPHWVATVNAHFGRGSASSLHKEKLAIDLHLFKDGDYQNETADHAELGAWWEEQHELCAWGGRFGDGNHYSIQHNGRR